MASKKKQRLTREHVDKFLVSALPVLLQRTRNAEHVPVAELIRVVEIERKIAPVKINPRQVIWVDNWK